MLREEAVTHRTQVATWCCDGMGHMNTRHIEAVFDDATAFFFALLGADPRILRAEGIGWADRKHTFNFLAEILAGDLIEVRSRPQAVGRTSITTAHRMTNAANGEVLAEAEIVTVCFDLALRRARPLPPVVARTAGDLLSPSRTDMLQPLENG